MKGHIVSLTTHIGYGRFHLEDLNAGEEFRRFDGTLAQVSKDQPYRQPPTLPICNHPYLPDLIWVWVHVGTSNAQRVFLHRTALVHAVTPEQARAIEARLRVRKEEVRS
jgi:hypothetical protein